MSNSFKGLIFTNHALQRMHERKLSQNDVWAVWYKPDQSRFAKSKGAWIYYKTWNNQKVEVVAKKNPSNEWVILSVWSKETTKENSSALPIKLPQRSTLRNVFDKILPKHINSK